MLEFMWSKHKELRLHFLWNVLSLTDELVSLKEFSFAFSKFLPMSVCADMSFEGCCMKCEQSSFF